MAGDFSRENGNGLIWLILLATGLSPQLGSSWAFVVFAISLRDMAISLMALSLTGDCGEPGMERVELDCACEEGLLSILFFNEASCCSGHRLRSVE